MSQWDEDDARADILLQHWGHDPREVRRLAALDKGLHWFRVLQRARYWSNTIDVLETCFAHLTAQRDGIKRFTEDDLDEIIQRVAERIEVMKKYRGSI
jgi:hypothetical protein